MRSRQLNFFIMPEDLPEINSFLLLNSFKSIMQPIIDIENIFVDDISIIKEDQFDKLFLISEKNVDCIKYTYIENQNYYLVNDITSNVIEFSRGGFFPYNPNELQRGRLYFVTHYYEKGKYIDKDIEFIKSSLEFMKRFKGKFLNYMLNSYGITENVLAWMKKNNKQLSESGLTIR